MRRLAVLVTMLVAGLVVALTIAGAPNLGAQSREDTRDRLRELMLGNYESLMRVMFLLSERQYADAAKDVETIQRHAEALAQNLGGRPSLFQTYALGLRARTENLRTLAETLAGNDRLAPELRRPELEYLHDVIAADFGEMAGTCVACHGHFMPKR